MPSFRHFMCSLGCVIALVGCASTDSRPGKFELGSLNDSTLETQFNSEWELRGGKRHTLGLALSGGGTKAGVFAHGVLHGLHDTGLLQQVDVISSVSGGGYAGYWYYSKLMEAKRLGLNSNDVFRDCFPSWWDENRDKIPTDLDAKRLKKWFKVGEEYAEKANKKEGGCDNSSHANNQHPDDPFRWQAHLLRWPDVFKTQPTKVTGDAQSGPVLDFLGQLGSLVVELTLGWTGIESNLPKSYQRGIERTWGLNPIKRDIGDARDEDARESSKWQFTNALPRETSADTPQVDPATMRWAGLQALYGRKDSPPIWVLNTTQGDKGDWPNMANLFELTPFSYGSIRYPHRAKQPPSPIDDLATAVRASAAFADSQGVASKGARSVMNTLVLPVPALRWGVRTQAINKNGETVDVRLSDGGGADNLGLVSLVRRGLDDIIVVDAAQDAQGQLEDLCWAKIALREEGLLMRFPQLQNFDKACDARYPANMSGQKLPDSNSDEKVGYNISDWMNPVVHGTVTWPQSGKITNLWLIKPAWRQTDVGVAYSTDINKLSCGEGLGLKDFNCFLLIYYGHNTKSTVSHSEDDFMAFPQHGTVAATANSSSYLTLAYRELGRSMAANLQLSSEGGLRILNDQKCVQTPYTFKKGFDGRPGPSLLSLKKSPTACVAWDGK